jgi:aryl-alcohol dehydrogenase-like predicted oxidoreductase
LDDLITSGKIRYVGCSNLYAWQIMKANGIAALKGYEPFVAGQYLYNLVRRDIETEILPACVDQGMGILCWSPLAAGLLTGKYRNADEVAASDRFKNMTNLNDRYVFQESMELVELLCGVAKDLGKAPATVALSWVLKDKAVFSVIAGARNVEQLSASMEAGSWDIPDEAYQQLKDKLPLNHGYPREWMQTALMPGLSLTEHEAGRAQRFPPIVE